MNGIPAGCPKMSLAARVVAAGALAWLAAGPSPAGAALVLTNNSSASTTYAVREVLLQIQGEGSNRLSPSGQLTAMQDFFEGLVDSSGEPINDGPVQTFGPSSLASRYSNTADSGQISDGVSFGTGTTNLGTLTSGTIAAGASGKTGLNWFTTSVTSGDVPAGVASVSVTTATAAFVNNSATVVSGYPGASVSLAGTLADGTVSFVAASLSTTITTTIRNVTTTINLTPIFFGYGNFGEGGSRTQTSAGTYVKLTPNGLSYNFSGISRTLNTVSFGLNDGFSVTSTLTLIADPASIALAEMTDPDAIALLPDFGTFAQNPAPDINSVPEPATLAAAAVGLALAAVARRRAR